MASLHDLGWRQGSLFTGTFQLASTVLGPKGETTHNVEDHRRWVIATQDCDLYYTDTNAAEATIELRPVFADDPPPDWGIRSQKFRLTDAEYTTATSPRVVVSAAVLSAVATRENDHPTDARMRAFKTWLGRRYDRPAVPLSLGTLATTIANEIRVKKNRPAGRVVRDVLLQFDEEASPPRFSLYAVLDREDDRDDVRAWLAEIARRVPGELGIGDIIDAHTAEGISLHLIETSYAADVAQLTWRPNAANPEGAEPSH